MSPSVDTRPYVRGDIIKKAFDEIEIIGRACQQLVIEIIESNGLVPDQDNWYRLSEIEKSLAKMLGEDATQLLMKRIDRGIVAFDHLELKTAFNNHVKTAA